MTTKRLLCALAFVLIGAGGFEKFYVRMIAADRRPMRRAFVELPYSKAPGLRRFLAGVAERTRVGDRVMIEAPLTYGWSGYEYVYARSLYSLAGRDVVALMRGEGEIVPNARADADWIAAWHVVPNAPEYTVVWRSADGVLLRKRL